ncbi:MAG: CO2 hydration protein [Cyanobacteria bacterium P01_C01_bin.121]
MTTTTSIAQLQPTPVYSQAEYVDRLLSGNPLLPNTPDNLKEVVGVLKAYGVVLDAYSINLQYIANHQFLNLIPIFKYFDGKITPEKVIKHLWHNRINYEYAEYVMRTMMWHGGGGLDSYLDSDDFWACCAPAIQAKARRNPVLFAFNKLFPQYLPEQVRQLAYYSGLGQFWRVMSDIFINLSDTYDQGNINSINEIVEFIKAGLVADAARPIIYSVTIGGTEYDIIPASVGLTFLPDTAVPYVESIFFRGTPFFGTVSYNAQAHQIPIDQAQFGYGALFADPLPIGGAGIPPTLLMQDMRHYVPQYLEKLYDNSMRGQDDVRVQLSQSFQKSMFCVTEAAVRGLMPFPADTEDPKERVLNRDYLNDWMKRLSLSRLDLVQSQAAYPRKPKS